MTGCEGKGKCDQGLSNAGDTNVKLISQHTQPPLGYGTELRQSLPSACVCKKGDQRESVENKMLVSAAFVVLDSLWKPVVNILNTCLGERCVLSHDNTVLISSRSTVFSACSTSKSL